MPIKQSVRQRVRQLSTTEDRITEIVEILGRGLISASSVVGVTWGDLYQGYVIHLCHFIDYMAESWGADDKMSGDIVLAELVKTMEYAYTRANGVNKDGG